mmetsp:Transcript_10744/g.29750  ORF Transcript_10744/g.29750 Transcript_10744/m.29750 type:complete len:204 (-) Transcript_10744:44-655(-)
MRTASSRSTEAASRRPLRQAIRRTTRTPGPGRARCRGTRRTRSTTQASARRLARTCAPRRPASATRGSSMGSASSSRRAPCLGAVHGGETHIASSRSAAAAASCQPLRRAARRTTRTQGPGRARCRGTRRTRSTTQASARRLARTCAPRRPASATRGSSMGSASSSRRAPCLGAGRGGETLIASSRPLEARHRSIAAAARCLH